MVIESNTIDYKLEIYEAAMKEMDIESSSVDYEEIYEAAMKEIMDIESSTSRQVKQIYEAAMSVDYLKKVLKEDPDLLVNNVARAEEGGGGKISPLQIACTLGNLAFVSKVAMAKGNRELVKNVRDRRGYSLLHLASAKGQVKMAKLLLAVDGNLCLIQDGEGMTALHVAAMKGHTQVLRVLVEANPFAAQTLTDSGETVLHVCVRYNRLEALDVLLHTVSTDIDQGGPYVNKKDEEDNTILHLATTMRRVQIIHNLLETRKLLEVNATNAKGQTALDVLQEIPSKLDDVKADMEIEEVLVKYQGKRGRDIERSTAGNSIISTGSGGGIKSTMAKHSETFGEMRSAILVLAVLLLTVTFTMGVSPPGGLWQEDDDKSNPPAHVAGKAIMGYKSRASYDVFVGFNTAGFYASLSVVSDVLDGWSGHFPYLSRATFFAIRVAMIALGFAYGTGVSMVSRYDGVLVMLAVFLVVLPLQTCASTNMARNLVQRYL